MTSPATRRILVLDENEDLLLGLRRALEAQGYEIEAAADGQRGLSAARERPPDLVILDVMLPGMDGYRVLETLRDEGLGMPVMILSGKSEEIDILHGFRVGADDYVTKPFRVAELLARVHALLRRGLDATRMLGILQFGDLVINTAARAVSKSGRAVYLTPREFDLLVAFGRRPGAVLSRPDLLRDVWGYATEIDTRSVDIHVGQLRRKLESNRATPRHFVTVRKSGYRFDP